MHIVKIKKNQEMSQKSNSLDLNRRILNVSSTESVLETVAPLKKFVSTVEKRPLNAFAALRDTTPSTSKPVQFKKTKKICKNTVQLEKPEGYFKRPDGTLYYHCNGKIFERGSITAPP